MGLFTWVHWLGCIHLGVNHLSAFPRVDSLKCINLSALTEVHSLECINWSAFTELH
jgi:hypothetical protein